jgi:hypothetical protein
MPLDLLGVALVGPMQKGAAPRCPDAQGRELDVIVKIMQRDDPSRRSYLQRRWHTQAVGCCSIERMTPPAIVLSRR